MEKNLQQKIRDLCEDHGMLCYKVEAVGTVGFPDLYLAGRGRHELWEIKHPGKTGRLRPGQNRRIQELRNAGVTVRVIDDYETAKEIIDDWRPYGVAAGDY